MKAATLELKVRQGVSVKEGPSIPAPTPTSLLLNAALWLMLWGGYNTEFGRVFETDFPGGFLDFFHGMRALFPLLAAFLAGLKLLARRPLALWPLRGPLGLLALYALVGLISSTLLSPEPLTALCWWGQYASVLVVIWATLAEEDPVPPLSRLISLNWIIIALLAGGFLAAIAMVPDIAIHPGGLLQVGPSAAGLEGGEDQVLGMATTRSTGVGRYAAIAALVALANLWQGTKRSRVVWSSVLVVSLSGLVFLEARTALIAFLAGAFLLLWLRRGSRPLFLAAVTIGGLLLGATGAYEAFWSWFTRGQAFDVTLTGRTVVWQRGWEYFQESPLLGLGFHADRILIGTHMHNALFHALIQTGIIGGIPFLLAFIGTWVYIFRLYLSRRSAGKFSLPFEIPGVIVFLTVGSITESTFALYGVPWLLAIPCLAYLQVITRKREALRVGSRLKRSPKVPLRRSDLGVRPTLPQRA